jgi:hypothetical protein
MIRKYYSHKIADEKKRRKHKEADERDIIRKQHDNTKQLEKLDKEGTIAKKERARLLKRG